MGCRVPGGRGARHSRRRFKRQRASAHKKEGLTQRTMKNPNCVQTETDVSSCGYLVGPIDGTQPTFPFSFLKGALLRPRVAKKEIKTKISLFPLGAQPAAATPSTAVAGGAPGPGQRKVMPPSAWTQEGECKGRNARKKDPTQEERSTGFLATPPKGPARHLGHHPVPVYIHCIRRKLLRGRA